MSSDYGWELLQPSRAYRSAVERVRAELRRDWCQFKSPASGTQRDNTDFVAKTKTSSAADQRSKFEY